MKQAKAQTGGSSRQMPAFLAVMTLLALAAWPAAALTSISSSGPFTLSIPGENYVLTTDLMFAASDGLTISADGVTLNLNGHRISGPTQDNNTFTGIRTLAVANASIKNGSVTNFGTNVLVYFGDGSQVVNVDASNSPSHVGTLIWLHNCTNARVVNCTANYGFGVGISVSGIGNTLTSSTVNFCSSGSGGISLAGSGHTVRDSRFNRNLVPAINLNFDANNCLIQGNTFTDNQSGVVLYGSGIANNRIQLNTVSGSYYAGIWATSTSGGGNRIQLNRTFGNGASGGWGDLRDEHNNCSVNLWKNNSFGTAVPSCIQ